MKTKVLFLVSDFYHGGAQREMFELDSVIDKTSVDVSILCLSGLNNSEYFTDFFYEKHLDIKTTVFFLKDIIPDSKSILFKKVVNRIGVNKSIIRKRNALRTFLNGFTRVFFMGEYVFHSIAPILPQNYFEKVIIFIMSARFQGEHYRNINKKNKYIFVSAFDAKEQIAYEFEGFKDYEHIVLPLSLNPISNKRIWSFSSREIKRIGIFTRLNKSKPLDPFFYALHILLKESFKVELYIYGAGDAEEAGYMRYLNHLDIESKIFFKGHQEDIKKTIGEENLDLVWFQGYKNRPAGYAGLDVCLTGVPMLFWDFHNGKNNEINSISSIYPHFKDLILFVKATKDVLKNEDLAKSIAQKQYEEVLLNKNMEKNFDVVKHLIYNEE
ncbi:hypothetical protein [Flavivirga sp. 57AJ16]|uniref:hypothetical protein n=1 Tax=Flavivirga sp. 57AJ16 TaxID=3025307 RepID=UPI002365A6CA|nr:hypothetical protein [Flavivirga sp. 57AJ16]MDD7885189.1 hypothetical protein [Flavivirga sp. 57AJ16]